jgi:hypothetical protein
MRDFDDNEFPLAYLITLRTYGTLPRKVKPWVRDRSTVYLWKEKDVAKAIEYVMLEQGDDLFRLDDDDNDT